MSDPMTAPEPDVIAWRDRLLREVQQAVHIATGEGFGASFDVLGSLHELFDEIEAANERAEAAQREVTRYKDGIQAALDEHEATRVLQFRIEELTRDLAAARAALSRATLSLRQRVTQTRLHSESVNGNCATACLASVFGGSIEEYDERVPFTPDWWNHVEAIFRDHGFLVLQLSPADGHPAGVCFVAGISPRGVRHLCVMQDGVIVHDPHPSRAGLTEITDYWAVIPWTFPIAALPTPTPQPEQDDA